MEQSKSHYIIFRSDTRQFLASLEFFSDRIEWSADPHDALPIDRYDTVEMLGREALKRLGDAKNRITGMKYGLSVTREGVLHVEDLKSIAVPFG